ncbi:MAG: type III pantothenate kinase [Candidatus Omnitrophota bacterium]
MLLAVDIGNTNINLGLFKDKRIIKRFIILTKAGHYKLRLQKIIKRNKVDDAIVCGVVPAAEEAIGKALRGSLGKRPYIIGKGIRVPIKNIYRKPRQVGEDRLVNAYAGVMLYGAPLIMVDFGTAVTFDIVSRKKEYLGGMIIPGLGISLEALNMRTALLPKIKLEEPKEFIGRDTKNSMLSGIIYGFAALSDDLVTRIRQKIGRNAKVIGTGGNIGLIAKYCHRIDKIDKDLTLKGLSLIYRNLLDSAVMYRSIKGSIH